MNRSKSQLHQNKIRHATTVVNLFPRGVAAIEVRGTVSPSCLLPDEREGVRHVGIKRLNEFAAGRLCARAALSSLGYQSDPLLVGPDRTPLWPSGVIGSISHTDDYCIAVVGSAQRFAGLGIDAELVENVLPELWQTILRPEEVSWLSGLDDALRPKMATVVLTAKEAFYKCQYCVTKHWLGFEDVIVSISGENFRISVCKAGAQGTNQEKILTGRFLCDGNLVLSAIAHEVVHDK